MVKMVKSCLQVSMKLFNSIVGLAGIIMMVYGLWLIRVWQSDMEGSSFDYQSSFPWFVHALIGLGISSCAISCLGHFAAHTAYSNLLYCYVPSMFLLLLLESAMMADIFLNFAWVKKDIASDPTGRFDDFKDFVESNSKMCKWIGVLTVLAQGVSILLAIVMIFLKTDLGIYYDSKADSAPPHLYTPVHQLPYFTFTNYV